MGVDEPTDSEVTEFAFKYQKHKPDRCTSKYHNVHWDKTHNKWHVRVVVNGKTYSRFFNIDQEVLAAKYANILRKKLKLEIMNLDVEEPDDDHRQELSISDKKEKTSVYKNVCWNKQDKRWTAIIVYNKNTYRRAFKREQDAAKFVNSVCDFLKIEWRNPQVGLLESSDLLSQKKVPNSQTNYINIPGNHNHTSKNENVYAKIYTKRIRSSTNTEEIESKNDHDRNKVLKRKRKPEQNSIKITENTENISTKTVKVSQQKILGFTLNDLESLTNKRNE